VKRLTARDFTLTLATERPALRERIVHGMTPLQLAQYDVEFESWAHDNQLPPPENGWRTWLMMAGRGFGKTRAGAEWIFGLGNARPNVRIALVGANIDDARKVMVEGVSGLIAVAHNHGRKLRWEPALGRLTWPNGSEAQLFSGDNADGLRGPEHDFAWCPPDARYRRLRSRRGAASLRPTHQPRDRSLLPGRARGDGCVDRQGGLCRCIYKRRLEVRRPG